jgi:hypothetical protein
MSAMATMDRLWDLDAETEHEPTLDELITATWSRIARHRTVECPVCGEEMTPHYGAQALPIGARCRGCASELR